MDMTNLVPGDLKNLALFMEDFNEDGIYDTVLKVEANAQNLPAKIHFDFDSDGVVDYIVHLEYYPDGKLHKKSIDKGPDGNIDMIETYVYDKDGNRSVIYDDNADGNPDYMQTINSQGETVYMDLRSKKEKFISAIDVIIINDFRLLGKKIKNFVDNVKEKFEDPNKQL